MAQLNTEKVLQRPLYVFDLPEELLYTLQLKSQTPQTKTAVPASPSLDRQDGPATSCGLCGLTFPTLQEQKSHVRSDLHNYNLKQKMRGAKSVTETEFEHLVGTLDESLSGSDSSETEDESDDDFNSSKQKDSTLSALLKRQAKITDGDAEDAPKKKERGSGKPPLLWFASPKLPNISLGVYRAIFSNSEQDRGEHLVETIQRKQLAAKPPPPVPPKPKDDEGGVPLPTSMLPKETSASGPHYFLCMIGGGHFAAMVVSLTPKLVKKSGIEDRSATVIAHKTFHRYTTRRKQGGSQSSNDNAKGNAHSAGSSLRRYNEVALTEEVRALLADWRSLIDSSELIFIRATGSTNRRTLFGPYEAQVLNHRDERIRGFPFSTRRATQSELMRAFVELTRVKTSTVDEAALAKQAEEASAVSTTKSENAPKLSVSKPPKPSKEEEEAALHTTQLQALIRRSKASGLLSYLQSNSLSPDFHFFPPDANHQSSTPLHLASASSSAICVTSLLLKAHADPTILNPDGRSAFQIAGDRATRDAFRSARAELGEGKWSWEAAGVGSPLSRAEVEARIAREKEEKAVEEAEEKARRKAEMERLRREDDEKVAAGRERKFGKGHALAAPKMTAEERRAEEARGMSDEMRLRLEREKRARAAEERMKRLQGK